MTDPLRGREADNDALIRSFVDAFEFKDSSRLAEFLHEDVIFENYGDPELRGRDEVLALWTNVFNQFTEVRFETLHQAVSGGTVIAEQVHGLALPGKPLAPIRNMAIYEVSAGKIRAWRDYTNPQQARLLLSAGAG